MKHCSKVIVCLFILLIINEIKTSPPQQSSCGPEYGQRPCVFIPAKPGNTPACANPGSTFCEKIKDYPETVIKTLFTKYKIKDILADETQTEFHSLKQQAYSPHDHYGQPGQPYNYAPYTTKSPDYYSQNNGASSKSLIIFSLPFFFYKPNFYFSLAHKFKYFSSDGNRRKRFLNATASKQILQQQFIKSIAPSRNKRQSPMREQLCETKSNYINPQAALNARGNWMYIVNGVDSATQLVKTETCASQECSNLCQLPNGYNSRCEQRYVQKRLIALDAKGDKFYTDTFWFPSCCVCTLSNF
ncbi:unnamed protein product [Diamesa serratosioi]